MEESDSPSNRLEIMMQAVPLSEATRQISELSNHWAKHGVAPEPVPFIEEAPEYSREWFPEPEWISGWDAFEILRLQTEPYEWSPPIARICQIISDQVDREAAGPNYALGRLPPSHELLKDFPLGSNHWFRALHVLLTIKGAKEIAGWEDLVSALYDWLGPYDSLRLRWSDLLDNALTLHWAWHQFSLPEAKQEPVWHFPKAMAWIATREYIALARIGHFHKSDDEDQAVATEGIINRDTQALGWLHTFITYKRCQCGACEEFGYSAYLHCTCISVAWEELVHYLGGLKDEIPELVFNIQEGWLSMTWPDGADKLRFLRRDILERWPSQPKSEPAKITAIPSKAAAEVECREWLRSAFAADSEKKVSKTAFQRAAIGRFERRLSVRGFLRVWDAIAADAGRSKPGRKS